MNSLSFSWGDYALFFLAFQGYQVLWVFAYGLVGRTLGVRATKCGVGMGPSVLAFTICRVLFVLRLVPLGSHVQFSDENDYEQPPFGASSPLSFSHQILLASSGPVISLIAGYAVLASSHMIGRWEPAFLEQPPIIRWCRPGSSCAAAGLEPGGRVVAVESDGIKVSCATWRELIPVLNGIGHRRVRFEYLSPEKSASVGTEAAALSKAIEKGDLPLRDICWDVPAVAGIVKPGSSSAGLFRQGDIILKVDGRPCAHWLDCEAAFAQHGPGPSGPPQTSLNVEVKRASEGPSGMAHVIVPAEEIRTPLARYGLMPYDCPVSCKQLAFGPAMGQSLAETADTFDMFCRTVLRRGEFTPVPRDGVFNEYSKHLTSCLLSSGGSRIAVATGVMGILLCIVNLIPVPSLVGGIIVYALLERAGLHKMSAWWESLPFSLLGMAALLYMVYAIVRGFLL